MRYFISYFIVVLVSAMPILKFLNYDQPLEPYFSNALLGLEIWWWLSIPLLFVGAIMCELKPDVKADILKSIKDKENFVLRFFRRITILEVIAYALIFGDVSLTIAFGLSSWGAFIFRDIVTKEPT